jgi:uncharacterized repeat protein (TIGR03847 family)
MEARYEFGDVTTLSAVTVGEPGKRTFFLAVGQQGKWLRVWLEKEQLQALAMAIRQLLFAISQDAARPSPPAAVTAPSGDAPSGLPSAELEIVEMSLGYNGDKATMNLSAHGMGPRKAAQTVLECRMTLSQLRELGRQADAACAAGRPRCIVCGGPIDPSGHVCPGSN